MKIIKLKKDSDKIEIRDGSGKVIVDIQIADSSHTVNVSLSFNPNDATTKISRVPQDRKVS